MTIIATPSRLEIPRIMAGRIIMAYSRINVSEAKKVMANHNAVVVDIRDKVAFNAGHIENSIHIDQGNVDEFLVNTDFKCPLIVCCYHGNASRGAADYFNSQGFHKTYSLDGGYLAWNSHL